MTTISYQFIVESIEYWDKKNGNHYHKIHIINVQTHDTVFISHTMEYGSREMIKQTACNKLVDLNMIERQMFMSQYEEIIYFARTQETTKQRDIKNW